MWGWLFSRAMDGGRSHHQAGRRSGIKYYTKYLVLIIHEESVQGGREKGATVVDVGRRSK